MMRITVVSQSAQEVVLRVEGWVSGADVDLLALEGEQWLRQADRLVLDLGGVQFVDEVGIALLLNWSEKRLVLRGGSSFVRALLEAHGLG